MSFVTKLAAQQARRLTDTGVRRGASGNGVWLAIAVVTGGFRLVRRLGTRKREVVFSQVLKPGESFNINHLLEDRLGRPRG